jgi:uncharacterized protein (DUF488 family)
MGRFFKLGHSNHTIEKWFELLRQHAIDVAVDVRSAPYSKYAPQFDQPALRRSLDTTPTKYLYLGAELGGRPANSDYYDATGRVVYGRLCEDPGFESGIARLDSGIQKYRVALVCGEEDPAHCHRRLLVGRVLVERGHTMIHIRGDGRLETDAEVAARAGKPLLAEQPALFAELEEDQWRSTASVSPKREQASSSAR